MDQKTRGLVEFYIKKYLNIAGIVFALVLMVPTGAILATWNTLPGEKLYPVKSYLEEVALKLVGDNFSARADLQTQFVDRRFNETERLLAQSSSEGLYNLALQIQVTKREIVAAANGNEVKDVVAAQEKAEKFVVQLREYEQKLEETKVGPSGSSSGSTSTNVPSVPISKTNTTAPAAPVAVVGGKEAGSTPQATPKQPAATPYYVKEETQEEIEVEVKKVQDEIKVVIEELEVTVENNNHRKKESERLESIKEEYEKKKEEQEKKKEESRDWNQKQEDEEGKGE